MIDKIITKIITNKPKCNALYATQPQILDEPKKPRSPIKKKAY